MVVIGIEPTTFPAAGPKSIMIDVLTNLAIDADTQGRQDLVTQKLMIILATRVGVRGVRGWPSPFGMGGVRGVRGSPSPFGMRGVRGVRGSPSPFGMGGVRGVRGSPSPFGMGWVRGVRGSRLEWDLGRRFASFVRNVW